MWEKPTFSSYEAEPIQIVRPLLSVRDVFEHQTVAGLATVARDLPTAGTAPVSREAAVGELPLTPIMTWLHQRDSGSAGSALAGFNQSRVVAVPAGARYDDVLAAMTAVLEHHDALRTRLDDSGSRWRLFVEPPGSVTAADVVSRVEADKLYGPIGLGGILGGIAGGLAVDAFVHSVGPVHLLLAAIASLVAGALLVWWIEASLKPAPEAALTMP